MSDDLINSLGQAIALLRRQTDEIAQKDLEIAKLKAMNDNQFNRLTKLQKQLKLAGIHEDLPELVQKANDAHANAILHERMTPTVDSTEPASSWPNQLLTLNTDEEPKFGDTIRVNYGNEIRVHSITKVMDVKEGQGVHKYHSLVQVSDAFQPVSS